MPDKNKQTVRQFDLTNQALKENTMTDENELPPEVDVVMAIAAHVNAQYRSDADAPEFRKQVFKAIMELYYTRIYHENYEPTSADGEILEGKSPLNVPTKNQMREHEIKYHVFGVKPTLHDVDKDHGEKEV